MSVTSATIPSASLVRRERLKAETRQAILDAARDLFVSDGIEATTMRAIAAKIGYTATAIYHHFRDKDALIEELCIADFTALGQAMYRIGRIEDPMDRLAKLGTAYAEFALANPSQYRFMFMTQQRHGPLDANGCPVHKPDEDAYEFLFTTVSEGLAAERFRVELTNPHEISQMMWGGIHGVISLWLTHGDDPYIEWHPALETIRTMVDVMIRGAERR
jgi:AcrR family transcriptional regulator